MLGPSLNRQLALRCLSCHLSSVKLSLSLGAPFLPLSQPILLCYMTVSLRLSPLLDGELQENMD